MLSAGSRLPKTGSAYARAYPWLDTLLTELAPRTPADTMSPRQQVRVSASFWYGLSSVLTLQVPYKRMIDSKNCEEAKLINERLVRPRASLELERRVHPPPHHQILGVLGQNESNMPKVKQAFKCRNF